jgi:hypothetical protein
MVYATPDDQFDIEKHIRGTASGSKTEIINPGIMDPSSAMAMLVKMYGDPTKVAALH